MESKKVVWEVSGMSSYCAMIEYAKECYIKNISLYVVPSIILGPYENYNKDSELELKKISKYLEEKYNTQFDSELYREVKVPSSVHKEFDNIINSNENVNYIINTYCSELASPCILCHAYMHIKRFILAKKLCIDTLISGERIFYYNNKCKINQTIYTLDFYDSLAQDYNVEIVRPLLYKTDIMGYENILNDIGIEFKNIQYSCRYDSYIDKETNRHVESNYLLEIIRPILDKIFPKENK